MATGRELPWGPEQREIVGWGQALSGGSGELPGARAGRDTVEWHLEVPWRPWRDAKVRAGESGPENINRQK